MEGRGQPEGQRMGSREPSRYEVASERFINICCLVSCLFD